MNKNPQALVWLMLATLIVLPACVVSAAESASPATKLPANKEQATESTETANWQLLFSEGGRRVELDSASIKKTEGNKLQAVGKITFERALPDAISGETYTELETLNEYDCEKRTMSTLRRTYRKEDHSTLREEGRRSNADLPVRTGTLDEKLLRAACRPAGLGNKATFKETVNKAKAAIESPPPRKELLRTQLGNNNHYASKPSGDAPAKPLAKNRKKVDAPIEVPKENFDDVHWAYEGRGGPENWGKLSPENSLCDNGKRQSPIDIRDGIRVDLPAITFNYRPSLFRIIDNGRTVQAGVSDNRISLLGKDYELLQVHFHRPSEERINGKNFDMVAHLVHRAYDGKLAVLAILMQRGSEHPLIQTLWNYLPLERNADVYPPGVPIDLNQLLPDQRNYYTYMGSLTAPPCTEGVLWLVMQTPIQVSSEQIGIFSRLYPNNVRPTQPQNGRLIKGSR